MAAPMDRRVALRQALPVVEQALDQLIRLDENRPLWSRTFMEWERQADAFDRAVTTTLLAQRALLEDSAEVETDELDRCPHCRSERLYLQPDPAPRKMQTPHGPVVLGHQSVRRRSCGRSLSPSGA